MTTAFTHALPAANEKVDLFVGMQQLATEPVFIALRNRLGESPLTKICLLILVVVGIIAFMAAVVSVAVGAKLVLEGLAILLFGEDTTLGLMPSMILPPLFIMLALILSTATGALLIGALYGVAYGGTCIAIIAFLSLLLLILIVLW